MRMNNYQENCYICIHAFLFDSVHSAKNKK